MRSLIDTHDQIIVPPEYPILLNVLRIGKKQVYSNEASKQVLFHQLTGIKILRDLFFESLGMDEQSCFQSLCNSKGAIDLDVAYRIFLSNCRTSRLRAMPVLVGDNNPVYSFYIKVLFKKFPDAKFIFLIRDVHDQFASLKKFDFEADNPFLQGIRWRKAAKIMQLINRGYPHRCILMKYEDLVLNPEDTLTEICKFLNVEFQKEMIDFHQHFHNELPAEQRALLDKFHSSLQCPIHSSKINSWESQLSKREVQRLEFSVGNIIEKFGYKITTKRNPFQIFPLIVWKIYDFVLHLFMHGIMYMPVKRRLMAIRILQSLSELYSRKKGKKS